MKRTISAGTLAVILSVLVLTAAFAFLWKPALSANVAARSLAQNCNPIREHKATCRNSVGRCAPIWALVRYPGWENTASVLTSATEPAGGSRLTASTPGSRPLRPARFVL